MAGISYSGVELRKLPPRFRLKIAQLLDVQDSWKTLMSRIPSETYPDRPKYTTEHIGLIERHGNQTGKLYGEILLDEWSTSGKTRPKVETLLELLQLCELYRAADYVALEILGIPPPERPKQGPASQVPLQFEESTDEHLSQQTGSTSEDPITVIVEKLNNQDYSKGNLINFSIDVLETVTKNFSDEFGIGSGAFGKVFKVNLGQRGPSLAIKLLHPASSIAEDQFVAEIRALSVYRHENLVSLIGFCSNGPQFCLIYEFVEGGSLLDAIACLNSSTLRCTRNPLSWPQRVRILYGVSKAVHFLHFSQTKPLIHRDIKSANILLDGKCAPKLADFGLAKSLSTSNQTSALTSTIFGTSAYMAPEAFRGDISPKMDVFSLGVVMLEVLTGLSPYDEDREGNDIVTYLEEAVLDEDIIPFIDSRAMSVDGNQASYVYSVSLKCLMDKKHRPTSDKVLNDLEPLLGETKNVFI